MLGVMGAHEEQVVLALLEAATGLTPDVETMCSLIADDFVYQVNVPLAQPIVGREAARGISVVHGGEVVIVVETFLDRCALLEGGDRPSATHDADLACSPRSSSAA